MAQHDANGRPLVPGCLCFVIGADEAVDAAGDTRLASSQAEYLRPLPPGVVYLGDKQIVNNRSDFAVIRVKGAPAGQRVAWDCPSLMRIDEPPAPKETGAGDSVTITADDLMDF